MPGDDAFTTFPSLHDLADRIRSPGWLWPSSIPRGTLTFLAAAPGLGKSLVALDLARRIIHGEPFPDGSPVPCPGNNVIIVDAEGMPALLDQRARARDIDRRRLFLMLGCGPNLAADLGRRDQLSLLNDMCRTLEPALVVVDSLAAALARSETSLKIASAFLSYLSALASRGDFAVLIIHHLRKRARSERAVVTPRVIADDLCGSYHIVAAARSIHGPQPRRPGPHPFPFTPGWRLLSS